MATESEESTEAQADPATDPAADPQADPGPSDALQTRADLGSRRAPKLRPQLNPEHPFRQGDVIAERYRIEGEIGRGGMGVVYRATQLVTNKAVAIKWLFQTGSRLEERTKRFLREARAVARVRHPNVADVYDFGEHIGEQQRGLYMVMSLLEGESLRVRLLRGGLSETAAVSLLMPALRGLAAAHAQGVIHRDLKPENIFLCDRGPGVLPEAVLLDFGMSKVTDSSSVEGRESMLTLAGAVIGTPQYMAPEQADGKNQVDARTDLYAMAVILYEAVAGRRQFLAFSTENLLSQLLHAEPTPLRSCVASVSEPFERSVMRALSRDPAQRQASVAAFAGELEAIGRVQFASGPRVSSLNPPALHADRTTAPMANAVFAKRAIAIALLALLLVGLAYLLRKPPPAPTAQPAQPSPANSTQAVVMRAPALPATQAQATPTPQRPAHEAAPTPTLLPAAPAATAIDLAASAKPLPDSPRVRKPAMKLEHSAASVVPEPVAAQAPPPASEPALPQLKIVPKVQDPGETAKAGSAEPSAPAATPTVPALQAPADEEPAAVPALQLHAPEP